VKFKSFERRDREVELVNQFEPSGRDVLLKKTAQFCSPVEVTYTIPDTSPPQIAINPIINPAEYLTCYSGKPSPSSKHQAVSTNQFGPLALNVRKRKTQLCVPTVLVGQSTPTPTMSPAPMALDHFELFSVKTSSKTTKFEKTSVTLEDAFLDERMEMTKPVNLGVPTDKNDEGINNEDAHLTCYDLKAPRFPKTSVEVLNQFGKFRLTLKRPNMLCVPSYKILVVESS
jgi:hypothetical protein